MTKFLSQKSNDIVVTMFNLETSITKFLQDYNVTIIEFLDSTASQYLKANDISTTKFLDAVLDNYLKENDISVTKFMEAEDNDISVTKFMDSDPYYGENAAKKGGKKSKS